MTITYLELSGDWEDFDVTLANLLTEDWDSDNTNSKTPEIRHSGNAINRRAGPTRKTHTDQIRIKVVSHSYDEENSDSSDTHNAMGAVIEYKIETDNKMKAEQYMREINRILGEAHPNSGTRVLKVDDTNSPILYFVPPIPNWTTDIPDVLGHGTVLYSGLHEVRYVWERS